MCNFTPRMEIISINANVKLASWLYFRELEHVKHLSPYLIRSNTYESFFYSFFMYDVFLNISIGKWVLLYLKIQMHEKLHNVD